METGEEPRKHTAWWVLGAIATTVLLLVSWNIERLVPKPTPPAGPLHVSTYSDGGTLEIIGNSVGTRVIEVAEERRFKVPLLTNKGSTGSFYGGLKIETEEENNRIIRCRVRREDAARAMLIEFRLREPHGAAVEFPHHLTERNMVFEDPRLSVSRSASTFEPADNSLPALHAEMARTHLPILIQHHDPVSGWIHLMGPGMFHEPWPDRSIATLANWDRSQPSLRFRSIRDDGEVVEFSLPNPDHHVKPDPITPVPLPFVHRGTDYTLTVKSVERFAIPGSHPFASVDADLTYTGPPVRGLKDGPLGFSGGLKGVTDEWGNTTAWEHQIVRREGRYGAFLPASSDRMSIDLSVGRNDCYPRRLADGLILLEGTVAGDGVRVDFTPGPDAGLLGIDSMPTCSLLPVSHPPVDTETKGWQTLQFKIAGKGNDLGRLEGQIGPIDDWRFPFFPAGEEISVGISFWGMGGSTSRSEDGFDFDRSVHLLVPPDLMEPGDTFRIGIIGKLPSDTVTIDLALPKEIHEP